MTALNEPWLREHRSPTAAYWNLRTDNDWSGAARQPLLPGESSSSKLCAGQWAKERCANRRIDDYGFAIAGRWLGRILPGCSSEETIPAPSQPVQTNHRRTSSREP